MLYLVPETEEALRLERLDVRSRLVVWYNLGVLWVFSHEFVKSQFERALDVVRDTGENVLNKDGKPLSRKYFHKEYQQIFVIFYSSLLCNSSSVFWKYPQYIALRNIQLHGISNNSSIPPSKALWFLRNLCRNRVEFPRNFRKNCKVLPRNLRKSHFSIP